ncbi:MAG TPA: lipid-A-disaccharide synthase N-terminal domain-containing protein [Rhodanobacteraceae bacterium]|nr:lipid-A-disaccharide synthase N-terminal domain-containing protein [Rhodanobacteraceae bacterium]
MDFVLVHLQELLGKLAGFEATPWKIVGFLGVGLFTSRWFVQMYYTRKYRRVVMPLAFWWLSIAGSVLLVAYFTFGKNDSVGLVSNLFPAFVGVYNLIHALRTRAGTAPAK